MSPLSFGFGIGQEGLELLGRIRLVCAGMLTGTLVNGEPI